MSPVASEALLLRPLSLKGLELKNRIVMPPMANNRATPAGDVTEALIEHYTARAPAVGLVIVEHSYVTVSGRLHHNQLGICEDSNVPGLMRLATAIQAAGTPAAIQITHAGGRAPPEACGGRPLAPSAIPVPSTAASGATSGAAAVPRELNPGELEALAEAFAQAARRAKMAGFAAVEIHGAHGFLLGQFHSPLCNRRTDAYGGDRTGRLRFPLEVVGAVRAAVGPDYPVMYRLGGDDLMPGGLTAEDAAHAAGALAEAGVDVIDVSGGLGGARPPGAAGEGYFGYLGLAVKAAVKVPVIVTGGVATAAGAERLLQEGTADLVGVGRALLADPDWAQKAAEQLHAQRPPADTE